MRTLKTISRIIAGITFAAMLAVTANAQEPPRFGEANSYFWDSTYAGTTYIDTITVEDTVPYFVMPDAVLNDQFAGEYDFNSNNAANNLESSWNWWTNSGNASGTLVDSLLQYAAGENTGPFVHLHTVSTGEDTIYVQEVSSTGCNGDTTKLTVVVVDKPAFTVSQDGVVDSDTIRICESAAGSQAIVLNSIADNEVTGGNMKFRLDISIDSLNSDQSVDGNVRTANDTVVTIAQTNGNNITLMNYNIDIVDGQITQYTFDFGSGLGLGSYDGGINDHISRKSDFLQLTNKLSPGDNEFDFYAPTTAGGFDPSIVYIVFPEPNTGPLYYIPNDFNN
jgi:hypothetical protein